MALLTFESRLDVPLVREMYEIRYVVNLDPGNRFSLVPVLGEFHDFRFFTRVRQAAMASHAFAYGRHTGGRCRVGIDMTMQTRNLVVRGMHSVTEFDGLNRGSVGEVFAVYPYPCEQSGERHESNKDRLLGGSERVEYRY